MSENASDESNLLEIENIGIVIKNAAFALGVRTLEPSPPRAVAYMHMHLLLLSSDYLLCYGAGRCDTAHGMT